MRPHLVQELDELARDAGIDVLGVAPADDFEGTRRHLEERRAAGLHGGMAFTYRNPSRSTSPSRALPGARSLVVGARHYRRADPGAGTAAPSGVVARYARSDHYAVLRGGLAVVAERLRADGWRARVLCDDNALVDREAAYRAGLGWYGKNANLLVPGRGSWFVLGAVVTDAPLPAARAPVEDGCGPCRRCLDGCPTGAIVAPGVVDARRCLAWLLQAEGTFPREHRVSLGHRIYGCDDCQEVCPPNRLDDRRRPPGPADAGEQARVDLLELLAADDVELLDRYGRWYIPRRQPRHLRRNALVALGNVGDGADPAAVSALRAALSDPDALLRAHAVWAARRLGRGDLVEELLAGEEDPSVLEEIEAPL